MYKQNFHRGLQPFISTTNFNTQIDCICCKEINNSMCGTYECFFSDHKPIVIAVNNQKYNEPKIEKYITEPNFTSSSESDSVKSTINSSEESVLFYNEDKFNSKFIKSEVSAMEIEVQNPIEETNSLSKDNIIEIIDTNNISSVKIPAELEL